MKIIITYKLNLNHSETGIKRKIEDAQNKKAKYQKKIAIGVIIVAILVAVTLILANNKESTIITTSIDGIECNQMEQAVFHIHAHLDIFINGQHFPIPAQIGILDNKCLYWLHTHDQSGIIHIEAPIQKKFTLGQFMDVWNSTQNIMLQYGTPKVFVNGLKVDTNYRDVELSAHDEIVIVYGDMPPNIPTFYQFPPGL